MKIKIIICGLFMVLLLLMGCSKEIVTKTDSAKKTSTPVPTPVQSTPKAIEKKETVAIDWGKSVKKPVLDSAVSKLVETSKDINNYQYFFQTWIRDKFGNYGGESYQVYIKGLKAKKVYASPKKIGNADYYSEVYLDLDQKKAVGVCDSKSVLCRGILNKKFNLSYDQEKLVKVPKELIQLIDTRAKKVEEIVIDNEKASVLKYPTTNNWTTRLSVGTYYGLPLRFEIYSYVDEEEILQEKYQYGNLIIDQVTKKEVNLS